MNEKEKYLFEERVPDTDEKRKSTFIGMMDIPDEKEIRAMMDEVKRNPQKYRYVA